MRLNSMWAPLAPTLPKRDKVRSEAQKAVWARRSPERRAECVQAALQHRAGWTREDWAALGALGNKAMQRLTRAERSALAVKGADLVYQRKLAGEKVGPNDKLTPDEVIEIRQLYRRWSYHGSNAMELAIYYGVTKSMICQIVRGVVWVRAKP